MLLRLLFYVAVYVGKRSAADGMSIANNTVALTVSIDPKIVDSGAICPDDSVSTDGVCKCDHERCAKPPCDEVLILAKDSSHVPGLCCPQYFCGECASENLIDSRCLCAPEAFLNQVGDCECSDPHKSLVNDTCICDPDKCELPNLCDDRSVPVNVTDGCCWNYKCVTCPTDSYPTGYNSADVEDKCVCFPCPETECNEPLVPNILRRGRNVPETCCDIYTCENATAPGKTCRVDDLSYTHGDSWNTSEGHNCTCKNGVSLCGNVESPNQFSPTACLSGDKVYQHLASWIEDTCTNCTCRYGKPVCIAYRCEINVSEMKITAGCPSLETCDKNCEYGYKVNKKGCNICKCNEANVRRRYKLLEMYIKNNNISESEALALLHRFNEDKTTTTESTRISSEATSTVGSIGDSAPPMRSTMSPDEIITTTTTSVTNECLNAGHLPYILHVVFFVLGVIVCCMLFQIRTCVKGTSYDYAPVKKATDNNNIPDMYSQKSTELSTIKLKRESLLN